MMDLGLTPASLAGAIAYAGTAALALWARSRTTSASRRWSLIAALFLALAVWRLSAGEMRLQGDLRDWMRASGFYEQRHNYQALLTLAIIAGAGLALYRVFFVGGFSRPTLALNAALGLMLFSLLRLISLHQFDSLLFRLGPIHINYLIDLGLTATAAILALLEGLEIPPQSAEAGPSRKRRRP